MILVIRTHQASMQDTSICSGSNCLMPIYSSTITVYHIWGWSPLRWSKTMNRPKWKSDISAWDLITTLWVFRKVDDSGMCSPREPLSGASQHPLAQRLKARSSIGEPFQQLQPWVCSAMFLIWLWTCSPCELIIRNFLWRQSCSQVPCKSTH